VALLCLAVEARIEGENVVVEMNKETLKKGGLSPLVVNAIELGASWMPMAPFLRPAINKVAEVNRGVGRAICNRILEAMK